MTLGPRTLPFPEMLSKDTARQLCGISFDSTSDIGRHVSCIQSSANRRHQQVNGSLLANDFGVVQTGFVEGSEIHDHVVCQGRAAELCVALIEGTDKSDDGVDGCFSICEAAGVGHLDRYGSVGVDVMDSAFPGSRGNVRGSLDGYLEGLKRAFD